IFLAFAISWSSIALTKLLSLSYGSFWFTVITAFLFMCAPAYATFLVKKVLYKEPLSDYGLQFKVFDYRWVIHCAIGTILFLFLTLGVVYLLGNVLHISAFGFVDFSEEGLHKAMQKIAGDKDVSTESLPHPLLLLLIGTAGGVASGALINLPFTFGEEFGWRGLLHKETQHWGYIKSSLFIGLIWGFWHTPIILMGHNYNNSSVTGVFMMILFCIAISFPMAYVRVKSKNVLGPSMLHGMLNGSANVLSLYIHEGSLLYNRPAGIAGILIILIFTIFIFVFDKSFIKEYKSITENLGTEG
ncbi:MAG: CPBP family intramembrane glutamic endopeptidase, partial [Bacteroidia bacterium]